jgi:FkbM family methyltransferase
MTDLILTRHDFCVSGIHLQIYDEQNSCAARIVAEELAGDEYGIGALRLEPGDCVVDIGGHLGIVAIFLAKRFPGIRVVAYEPHPTNRELFQRNVEVNQATGIEIYPEAVTGCGRVVELAGNPLNSGGYTAHSLTQDYRRTAGVPSLTLDQVFERHVIAQCALLKVDCEGSEYEILRNTTVWPRVRCFRGEFHTNPLLVSQGYSMQELRHYCEQRIPPQNVAVKFCRMSD